MDEKGVTVAESDDENQKNATFFLVNKENIVAVLFPV